MIRSGPRPPRPPRWAESLVTYLLGSGRSAHFIVGDLREEYARRPSTVRYLVRGVGVGTRLRWDRWKEGRPDEANETGGEGMRAVLKDVRVAARGMRRRPGLAAAVIVTLGVAIGATTAIVSAVEGVLLDPLPYHDPAGLVVMEVNTGGAGWYGTSAPEFFDAQRELSSLEALGGFVKGRLTLGDSAAPRRIDVAFATSEVLSLLGVDAAEGRVYGADEDGPTGTSVVLGHGLAAGLFGGESAVGRPLDLSGTVYTVVGVMPEDFGFPDAEVDAWVPAGLDRTQPAPRANHFLTLVGRLAQGVPLSAARSELRRFEATTRERFPENYAGRGFRARLLPLHEWVVGPTRLPLLILLGSAALVLTIACANVALLLLARAGSRRTEMSVRSALGASRGRLVRQLLAETAVLAAAGGLLGLGLATAGVDALVGLAPPGTPRLENVRVDAAVLAWAAGITLLAGLLFGLVPALRGGADGTRGGAPAALGSRDGGSRSGRSRRTLLATQIALAATVTLGAGLMVRSLQNLGRAELGFRPGGVLTLALNPPGGAYAAPEDRLALYRTLLDRVEAIPEVERAAATCTLPMTQYCGYLSLLLEGQEGLSIGDAHDAVREIVTPSYLETMGLTMMRGRPLEDTDDAGAPPVALVNETMAKTLWPGEEPVGQRFRMWSEGWPFMEVVGVVRDVRNLGPDRPADPIFYVPYAQAGVSAYATPTSMYLTVRTASGDPSGLAPAIRAVVRSVDASIPVSQVRPMAEVVGTTLSLRRATLRLLQTFTAVAILLAGVGVYGVVSVSVSERGPELGLRKAIGAAPGGLVARVMRESVGVAVLGAAVGVSGGVVLARGMAGLLYDVSTTDVPTVVTTFLLIVVVATAASLLPARRASRVDPMETLRREG